MVSTTKIRPWFGPYYQGGSRGITIPKEAKVTRCQRYGNKYVVYSWWENDEFYCVAVVVGPANNLYHDSNIPVRAYKKQGKRIGDEIHTDTSKKLHSAIKGGGVLAQLKLVGGMLYHP